MKRILWSIATTIAVLAIAIAGLWSFWLPGYVEGFIRDALRTRGVQVESLRVTRVSLDRIDVADVRVGVNPRLTVGEVRATYDLAALRARRVHTITVDHVRLEVDVPALMRGPPHDEPPLRAGFPSSTALPFDRLDVHSVEVVVTTAAGTKPWLLTLDASVVASSDGAATVDASGDLLGRSIHVAGEWRADALDLVASPLNWEFTGKDPLSDLVSESFGVRPAGRIEVAGRFRIDAGVPDLKLSLHTDRLSLEATSGTWGVEGIACHLDLDGIAPLRTHATQTITWLSARAGRAPFHEGRIGFAWERPSVLRIEEAGVRIGKNGRIDLAPFTVDPALPDLTTSATATRLALEEWLELASKGRASGEGEVSGHVELRVRTKPRLRVDVGGGKFHSGAGLLRVRDTAALRKLLGSQVPTQGPDAVPGLDGGVMERVTSTLQDFAYSSLDIDLVPRGDDLDLRSHLVGRGRKNAQEIDLNLNVNGFDALVDMAVNLDLGMGHAER